MKGCSSIVEAADYRGDLNYPCQHEHLDNDDQDLYTQVHDVEPLFGVSVSMLALGWSYRKFVSADVFMYKCSESDIKTILGNLTTLYGEPTSKGPFLTGIHYLWKWPHEHIRIGVSVDTTSSQCLTLDFSGID
jgi:hypothetical protein